jgi:hypothetical protein
MVTKVTTKQLVGFELWYFDTHNPIAQQQRYGQAFINYCLEGSVNDPALFYEEDTDQARTEVWLNYIED